MATVHFTYSQSRLTRPPSHRGFAKDSREIQSKINAECARRMATNESPTSSNAQTVSDSRNPAPHRAPPSKRSRGCPRTRYHPYAGRTNHHLPAQPHFYVPARPSPLATTATATTVAGLPNQATALSRVSMLAEQPDTASATSPAGESMLPTAPPSLSISSHQGQQQQSQQAMAPASRSQTPQNGVYSLSPADPLETAPRLRIRYNHGPPSRSATPVMAAPCPRTPPDHSESPSPAHSGELVGRPPPHTSQPQEQDPSTPSDHRICDENPVFFSGLSDLLVAKQFCYFNPQLQLHDPDPLPCSNTSAHPLRPHLVCTPCHRRGDQHLKKRNHLLLCKSYVPLCRECATGALDTNRRKHGFLADCTCFTAHPATWLCFDCRESGLMRAQSCWEAEMLEGHSLPFMQVRICRCGRDVRDWWDADGEVVRVWVCITCEGVHLFV